MFISLDHHHINIAHGSEKLNDHDREENGSIQHNPPARSYIPSELMLIVEHHAPVLNQCEGGRPGVVFRMWRSH
jgi:hypothetical protein